MKTTLDLPDDLMKEVKLRAVRENRRLKDEIADLLRRGLSRGSVRGARVTLPLVRCAHTATHGQELTPDRVAGLLLDEEAEAHGGPAR